MMTNTTNGNTNGVVQAPPVTGWMSDVQRVIALILVGTFAALVFIATARLVINGESQLLNEMAKTLQSALVNMSLIALGFFFGSNSSKVASDAGAQRILEAAVTPKVPPPPGMGSGQPWWPKLTEAERTAIANAKSADPKIDAFITAATSGAATADDLTYLVSKGLLTPDRTAAIQGT